MSQISRFRDLLDQVSAEYESLWAAHVSLQKQHSRKIKRPSPIQAGDNDATSLESYAPLSPRSEASPPPSVVGKAADEFSQPPCDLDSSGERKSPKTALLFSRLAEQSNGPEHQDSSKLQLLENRARSDGLITTISNASSLGALTFTVNDHHNGYEVVEHPNPSTSKFINALSNVALDGVRPSHLEIASATSSAQARRFDVQQSFISRPSLCSRDHQSGTGSQSRKSRPSHSLSLYPVWWNPSKRVLAEIRAKRGESHHNSLLPARFPNADRFVLSPVNGWRLSWDFLCGLLILIDAWVMPFDLVYCSNFPQPRLFDIFSWLITVAFTIDIMLNFVTGYLDGHKIMLTHRKIVENYLKRWFWLDVAATAPWWSLLNGTQMAKSLRFFKMLKLIKTVRFIKIFQRLRNLHYQRSYKMTLVNWQKYIPTFFVSAVLLYLSVHWHTCVWVAIKSDEWRWGNLNQAFNEYIYDFQAVYISTVVGAPLEAQTVGMHLFALLVAIEHLIIWVLLIAHTVFKFMMLHGDAAWANVKVEQSLRYMRRHRLPSKTQIQVLYGLHEAGSAKAMQKDFINLLESDLPHELQRKISFELWGTRLKTLGLIDLAASWDEDFIAVLALSCREEVLATHSLLFSEEDPSYAAYFVISGEMNVTCLVVEGGIPPYKAGMWLGESALVNPAFRRGLSASAACLVSLMMVPAKGFHGTLQELGLMELFEHYCQEELWRGLCGRCGKLGRHFSDACPDYPGGASASKDALRTAQEILKWQPFQQMTSHSGDTNTKPPSLARHSTEDLNPATRELHQFLKSVHLYHLASYLEELAVFDVEGLTHLDIDDFRRHLATSDNGIVLSANDIKMLSPSRVKEFQQKMVIGKSRMSVADVSEQHLLFLSHYKLEAGTEAALMRSELEQLIAEDPDHPAREYLIPVFLDSEDLTNLKELQHHVKQSSHVALLLTNGVLSRPWCLVEIVTAVQHKIPVCLVEVAKRGNEFNFPDDAFFRELRKGKVLDKSAMDLLSSCRIDVNLLESTLREVFKSIAVPYSPHRPFHVRRAELSTLLQHCGGGTPAISKRSSKPHHTVKLASSHSSIYEQSLSNQKSPDYRRSMSSLSHEKESCLLNSKTLTC